jgi:hypothetical protein
VRIGIIGSSVAVMGWSAGLAAFAPGAGAASGQHTSATSYNSSATATTGAISIAGNDTSLLTDDAVTGSGPEIATLGSARLVPALKSVPALGPVLAASFQAASPASADLLSESATATSDGTSAACAAVLSGDCTANGKPQPIILKLGLSDLNAALTAASPSGSRVRLPPDPLADYAIVLTISGPEASCAAGPAGSGRLSASEDLAKATLDLQDNGKSMLPAGPIALDVGNLFTQLGTTETNSPLAPLLTALSSALPLALAVDPGSKSLTGSASTATTGQVVLSALGTTVFDVKSASVTCGPNTKVVPAASVHSSPAASSQSYSTAPADSAATPAGSVSNEIPLSSIQTDEGRSTTPFAQRLQALDNITLESPAR